MVIQKRRRSKIKESQQKLRARLWPKLDEARLWHRQTKQGFITIPRPMPLIMEIMDDMANGKPVSSAYLELWCRSFDEGFVTLSKQDEIAFASGFSGQRGTSTWRQRMKILQELGFIDLAPGPSGPMSYALIWNPYFVIKDHKEQNTPGLREDLYNALMGRAYEIGADDFDEVEDAA
jgi:hypothetical protein